MASRCRLVRRKTVRLYFDGKIISEKSIEGTLGRSGSAPRALGRTGENREIFLGGIDDVRSMTTDC